MTQRRFRCNICGDVFDSDRPDEEAEAEFERNFGRPLNPDEAMVICGDCYDRLMSRRPPVCRTESAQSGGFCVLV